MGFGTAFYRFSVRDILSGLGRAVHEMILYRIAILWRIIKIHIMQFLQKCPLLMRIRLGSGF